MLFFFFNDTATTEIYTLSLHDALPISLFDSCEIRGNRGSAAGGLFASASQIALVNSVLAARLRSEEHTSELQSRLHLVCRLLLEKKKIVHLLGLHEQQGNPAQHSQPLF